ncbi:MAG: hypothetical protein ROW48_00090 [Bellilinea sp.]
MVRQAVIEPVEMRCTGRRTEVLPQVMKAGWAAPVRRTCLVARQTVTPQAHLHCAVRSAVQVCGVIELAEMRQPLAEGLV